MRTNPEPKPIAAHERFTIAHEIGHYVLQQESGFHPRRRAEYWLGEDLCQHFASALLIRPEFLVAADRCGSTSDLMAAVNEVARQASVTAEPAALALIERISHPVAIGTFVLDPLRSTRRLGFRGWWVENREWWAKNGGRQLAVYEDHPLAPALRAMARLRPGQVGSPSLEGANATALRRRRGPRASFVALLGG
jgi:IrrE N-terminal-like domain